MLDFSKFKVHIFTAWVTGNDCMAITFSDKGDMEQSVYACLKHEAGSESVKAAVWNRSHRRYFRSPIFSEVILYRKT